MFASLLEKMSHIDALVVLWAEKIRTPGLFEFFKFTTYAGTIAVTAAIAVITSIVLIRQHKRIYVLYLWLAYVGAELTTWAIKYMVNRPRPDIIAGVEEFNPSFPSGHATAVTSIALYIAYVLVKSSSNIKTRISYIIGAFSVITFVSFSRIYLNLHYLSDVVFGFLIGLLWVLISCYFCEISLSKTQSERRGRNR
ncbi:phosphatase PAP2 family protein [Klebsiella sp. BIGb0407]|uniref:phosphatase PAP2 family protein n=1 Tax=Klebsiella sp. BIGb0407 TaxID=2940603 RepID=UPI00216706B4|nr:phosphatase PAP2 family protein [Klebsiella sp. BIGb0407]MCS3429533.1 undecaprenyl-diphosphatase [Klebsiella sp. BIGb0407]